MVGPRALPPPPLPAEAELRDRMVGERDVHRLDVAVELEAVVAPLAAYPAALDPPERRPQVADVLRVDPAQPGVDRLRDPVAAFDVVRPDVRGEAVLDRVRKPD